MSDLQLEHPPYPSTSQLYSEQATDLARLINPNPDDSAFIQANHLEVLSLLGEYGSSRVNKEKVAAEMARLRGAR